MKVDKEIWQQERQQQQQQQQQQHQQQQQQQQQQEDQQEEQQEEQQAICLFILCIEISLTYNMPICENCFQGHSFGRRPVAFGFGL